MKFCRSLNCIIRTGLLLLILPVAANGNEPLLNIDAFLENTTIAQLIRGGEWQGLNRLRLDSLTTSNRYDALTLTFLGDARLYYDSFTDEVDTDLSVYRLYGNYEGQRTRIIAGRQRIPFGVGRIWTPVDIFNPIDATSIEPDEREGTDSLRIEYSMNHLSIADATISEDKSAARLKGFLTYGDAAVILQYDVEENESILGWELEGDPTSSGVEMRSEGGFFYDKDTDEMDIQAIIGAEYGFPNSLTLLAELFHDGRNRQNSLGITASYQLSMLTFINLLAIVNMTDGSSVLAPTVQYSASDEMTLEAGVFINNGGTGTTYGNTADTLYLRWFAHF